MAPRTGPEALAKGDLGARIEAFADRPFARRLRLFGLRRSGNHAVLNWMFRNLPEGDYVLFNNCSYNRSPLLSYNQIESSDRRLGKRKQGSPAQLRFMERVEGEAAMFVSYEKYPFSVIDGDDAPEGFGEGDFDRTVLLDRSYLSWLASIMKLLIKLTQDELRGTRLLWREVEYYRASLASLAAGITDKPGRVRISYDAWVLDEDYRRTKLDELGLPLKDNGLGEVASYGGGSSFDGHAKVEAQTLTERWRGMQDDEAYRLIVRLTMRDPELRSLIGQFYPADLAAVEAHFD